jgi:hypothetical protein
MAKTITTDEPTDLSLEEIPSLRPCETNQISAQAHPQNHTTTTSNTITTSTPV